MKNAEIQGDLLKTKMPQERSLRTPCKSFDYAALKAGLWSGIGGYYVPSRAKINAFSRVFSSIMSTDYCQTQYK